MKAATWVLLVSTVADVISIHAAREGGDVYITCLINVVCISIHAAREGGDDVVDDLKRQLDISIHAAREGGDCGNE